MGTRKNGRSYAQPLNTQVKRSKVPQPVRERIWGRAAARCVLCAKWLIDEREFWHAIPTGQIAHNVAAENGAKAPRGDSPLGSKERAAEENLLLLCGDCHRRIDSPEYVDKYTVQFLTEKKNEHERWVRDVTDFARLRPAIVLRMTSQVRGTFSPASKEQVGEALRQVGLTGMHADSRTGLFDIRALNDETDGWAWDAAGKEIRTQIARIHEAIAAGDASVVAVFALAPIPMLVELGAELDDKTETLLFRRARRDTPDAWAWTDSDAPAVSFGLSDSVPGNRDSSATDVVAFVDVSVRVDPSRVPPELADVPTIRLSVAGEPSADVIATRADLESFARAWRDLLSTVESRWPNARRLHILAAVPATAAVSMGRHRMRAVHPTFVLYQREEDGTDVPVMEVRG
ncbi:SAVED domain-containing protein [Microbacterium sp. 2MCAF23]|uniref:SAVED domain-containing protein n=1 Tax=Microbacterium sp. 2MCAF23 TaxID=3232985 RepID=UPI003F971576